MRWIPLVLSAVALPLAAATVRVAAQDPAPQVRPPSSSSPVKPPVPAKAGAAAAPAGPVRLVTLDSTTVRPVLRALWERSVEANREFVACLGGHRDGDRFRITRAAGLESLLAFGEQAGRGFESESDSVSVGERLTILSIETCRPPEWIGTVHTHSSRQEDLRYPKLSSFDRTVISLWHARWRHESVFCVLFSEAEPPYCEHQGGALGTWSRPPRSP